MKFYQSYYGYEVNRYDIGNKEELNSYVYALSCHYLKKLGQEVSLYVNGRGHEILKPLPYDKVEALPENVEPKAFWAYGKMLSHKQAPLGAVHIDGDVIITKMDTVDYIAEHSKDADLFIQHEEGGYLSSFHFEDEAVAEKMKGELKDICPPEINFKHPKSFHCGLLKLNNQKLKDRYLDVYFSVHEALGKTDFYDNGKKRAWWVPDLVVEQAYLWDIVKYHGYKYAGLFPFTMENADYWCNTIYGYKHFSAHGKYKFIERIRAELRAENRALYEAVLENNIRNGEKGLYKTVYTK